MRVHEIEEAINVLHDLDRGKLGAKALCYLRDKKSRFKGEGEMRGVLKEFKGRLDLEGNLIVSPDGVYLTDGLILLELMM